MYRFSLLSIYRYEGKSVHFLLINSKETKKRFKKYMLFRHGAEMQGINFDICLVWRPERGVQT